MSDLKLLIYCGVFSAFILSSFVVFIGLVYTKNHRKHYTEKKILNEKHQHSLTKVRLEITEEITKTISEQIHSKILQGMTIMKHFVENLENKSEAASTVLKVIEESIKDTRLLSRSLDGSYMLSLGVERAIKDDLEKVKDTSVIETSFHSEGEALNPDEMTELIIYRSFLETLNNSLRHSKCTKFSCEITYESNQVIVKLSDNGIGFDIHQITVGLGLKNIQSRMKLIGGKYEIFSLDQGTCSLFKIKV